MKYALLIAMFLMPGLAKADNATSAQLLRTLIENSASIQLVGDINPGDTIAARLAEALAQETMVNEGQYVALNSVSSRCAVKSRSQGTVWECSLTILDGDYLATGNGYKGPDTESSVTYTFEAVKASRFHIKGTKVTVSAAG